MALPLLHAGTGAGGVPNVGALKWSSGGAFVWSDDDYIVPSLDLNFALFKDLRPRIGPTPTFTRASGNATYFNSSGVLTTAAINGPRFDHVYNGVSWVSKGLLVEEPRTNSLNYSEAFDQWTDYGATVTTNQIVAPDGTTTVDLILEKATTDEHLRGLTTTTSSVAYSVSFYVKKHSRPFVIIRTNLTSGSYGASYFNLDTGAWGTLDAGHTGTVNSLANGFFRITLTATSLGSSRTILVGGVQNDGDYVFAGDVTKGLYIWGAQLESGAFPTSYIPTTSAAVTRSADVCQITGTDFSGFYNQSEGSFAVEYDRVGVDNSKDSEAVLVTNSSGTHQYYIDAFGGNEFANFYISPTMQASLALGSVSASGIYVRTAIAYKINDFAASINGAVVVTDTSGTVPTVDRMGIGRDIAVGNFTLSGHIARLRYFNTRLTNSQLQVLST